MLQKTSDGNLKNNSLAGRNSQIDKLQSTFRPSQIGLDEAAALALVNELRPTEQRADATDAKHVVAEGADQLVAP